jgi:hypothetical protein
MSSLISRNSNHAAELLKEALCSVLFKHPMHRGDVRKLVIALAQRIDVSQLAGK